LTLVANKKTKKVLISLTSGGFGFQSSQIIKGLSDECEFIYLTNKYGRTPNEAGVPDGIYFRVPEVQTVTAGNHFTTMYAFIVSFIKSLYFILKHKPDCAVSLSMPQGVFMLLAARLCGVETVYVESITRVNTPSKTTKLCLFLKASKNIFVQWEPLLSKVKGSKFGGRII